MERSYRGDGSRLLDIVRSSIVVATVTEAKAVLQLVLSKAKVHMIKNRLDPSYDGKETGGYRDINVQLSLLELTGTPFESLVFELQIILQGILAVKTNEGHKRYITCRDLRGD